MLREPLIIPLSAFALGIQISHFTDLTIPPLAAFGVLLTIFAILSHLRRNRWLMMTCVALVMVCAGGVADVSSRSSQVLSLNAEDGETLILSGCVVQPPVLTADRERFVLELAPGARVNVALSLRDGEAPPQLNYGQRVEFEAKVRRPRNFRNPGAFDYVHYLARQQVYWTASARASAPITTLPGSCGSRIQAAIFGLRVAALQRIEQLYAGDEYAIAMMEAILIGESGKLEKVWTDHFRRTGTYHALVISGMHIIVLAGMVLMLLRLLFVPEMYAIAIAAACAWLYAAVSGGSAPVVRAAGGFTLYLIGRYMFRRQRPLNLLAAIALIYLACDPGQLFEASFQLSFLCIASIGAFATPLIERVLERYRPSGRELDDSKRDMRIPRSAAEFRVELRLAVETIHLWTRIPERRLFRAFELTMRFGMWVMEMVLLSAVVQVALALPMALYFHRISVTGLTANLLVVPLMNALVPVGFAAIFTGLPPVAWLARILLNLSQTAAGWHVQFEPMRRIPDPPAWLAIVLVAATICVAVHVRMRSRWLYASVPAALGLFTLMFAAPFPADIAKGNLELTAIDVGQGDGLMLTTPEGKVILVDAGGLLAFGRKKKPNLDIGEDVISPYLWTRRIQHADVIATTHAHEDHVGGFKALIDNFRPAEIWTGALPERNIEADVLAGARSHGIHVRSRTAGESFNFGGAHFDVLSPAADHESDPKALNNDSLALRVSYGQHSFLLTGDIERQVEWQLADRGLLRKTTVLKVAHHGSRTSSTPAFLDAVKPEFAIISAGYGNMFRHPNPDVVERLLEHHSSILRTDERGLISIRTDGRHLTIRTMSDEQAFVTGPFQAW